MRRITAIMLSVLLMTGIMSGCAGDTPETTAPEKVESTSAVPEGTTEAVPVETTELVTEEVTEQPTEKKQMGVYTLEEVQDRYSDPDMHPRIYIAYEDNSLNYYYGGVYRNLSYRYGGFNGMYMKDRYLYPLPIDDNTTLALFCNDNFFIKAYPVHNVVNVISYDDGYGELWDITGGYKLFVFNSNTDYSEISIHTIDGKPSGEYEAIVYDGNGYSHHGFQDVESVKIAIVEGTKVVENEYDVDAKYYDCDPGHNGKDEVDSYDINWTPTVEGYAKLDFTDVPEGQYVLYLKYAYKGESYIRVYLANIEH